MPGAASSAADFGGVWGGSGEAKILDFRIFFDDFSKHILKAVSERPKKEKKVPKAVLQHVLGSARRNVRGPGER